MTGTKQNNQTVSWENCWICKKGNAVLNILCVVCNIKLEAALVTQRRNS